MLPNKLCLLLNVLSAVNSYNILAILPHRGRSHAIPFQVLTKVLAQRGHNVTSISHFPLHTSLPNHTDVNLNDHGSLFFNSVEFDKIRTPIREKWLTLSILKNYCKSSCEIDFASDIIRDFANQNDKFDVIIAQIFTSNCFLSFSHKFKAPVVGFTTAYLPQYISEKFGNPVNPAYIPTIYSEFWNPLSFTEKLENLLLENFHNFYYNYEIMAKGENITRKYFGEVVPSLTTIVYNVSLLLVTGHFTFNPLRPLVPAVVDIGGIHITKRKMLPDNLEKWINESTHGVIYFSLGSMIKGHTFPDEKRQEFLKAFARLPQRVLWKWENETMPGKPDNVMIQKWMPQLDILCHPNVKAFISHGGLLGTTEAVHCGVPAMVMPQYGDQFTNAKALEANGGGVILHLYEATEEKVYNALKTILDPNFKKQAEELSARFRDRPMPPLETAIYWVEYVARHRGAHHMRTAAVGMPLYKYLLLDVIAFLLLVFGLVFAVLFYITRAIFRKLFGRKDKQKSD